MKAQSGRGGPGSTAKKVAAIKSVNKKKGGSVAAFNQKIKKSTAAKKRVAKPSMRYPYGR